MEAAEERPLAATTAAPIPVAAAIARPTATDPSRVAADRPSGEILEGPATGLVPIRAARRRRAPTSLPVLTRQEEGRPVVIGRHVVATEAVLGRQEPTLGLGVAQGLLVGPRRPGVVPRQVGPVVPATGKAAAIAGATRATTEVGIRPAKTGPIP